MIGAIYFIIIGSLIVSELQKEAYFKALKAITVNIDCTELLASFNASPTWPKLSYLAKVIQKQVYGYLFCECCKAKEGDQGRNGKLLRFQTDHIWPRSKYKEYELELSNTQILCEECNQSKSNIDFTDWR
jgi:hypothetical protein